VVGGEDLGAAVSGADAEVVHLAGASDADFAAGVDVVVAQPVVGPGVVLEVLSTHGSIVFYKHPLPLPGLRPRCRILQSRPQDQSRDRLPPPGDGVAPAE